MMYKLSLIIPIYNVEKYIQECLQSVIEQIVPEVEVLIVNDGTPDQSMSIVKSMLKKLSSTTVTQFVIINQDNKGLSEARNAGIDRSTGNYIGFLDSDDKLLPGYFDNILPYLDGTYDIIDFNLIDSNNNIYQTSDGTLDGAFSLLNWYSPGRVIKAESFIKTRFKSNIHYEDVELLPKLYLASKKIKHINHPLYYYRDNDEGITKSSSHVNTIKTLDSLQYIFNEYIRLFRCTNNHYYALIALQAYTLLCFNTYRKCGTQEAFKLIDKYRLELELIKPKRLPIDKQWFGIKLKAFYYSPKIYLLANKANSLLKSMRWLKS